MLVTATVVGFCKVSRLLPLPGRTGAGYVGPGFAAALAAVPELRDRGEVARDEEVVVFDCGIGQKYPPPPGLPDPPHIDPSDYDPQRLARQLLAPRYGP